MYAAGKIPGSFFKREGRPSEKGILTARMIDRPIRPLFPKGWHRETQIVATPMCVDHVRPLRHPRDERRLRRARAVRHPVPDPDGRGADRQARGQVRGQPGRGRPPRVGARPDRGRHRRRDPDGRGRRERDHRGRAARRARDRARRDQEAVRRPARAAPSRPARRRSRSSEPQVDEGLLEQITRVPRRRARPRDAGRGQARAPGRDQGRRGGRAREVRAARRGRPTPSTRSAGPRCSARSTSSRRTSSGERIAVDKRRPDGRARGRDPRDLGRGRDRAAHARLRDLHPRPDAGVHGRDARHEPRGAAPRHARPRDGQALLPPLQLPAVLGRGGGLHARAQAPRHRPRRARRAGAPADDPVAGGVPVHDPRRVRHPRVQRLLVDGLGLRLDAVADGRRREDQASRSRASRWA